MPEHKMTIENMVERFQCPGCVCGCDMTCGNYCRETSDLQCTGHVLGKMLGTGNNFALGLPKGFHKPGINWDAEPPRNQNQMQIRLWTSGTHPKWDHLNVAVWAMEHEGFLFVRTYSPRINDGVVDVIEDGDIGMVPLAIVVSAFIDEID